MRMRFSFTASAAALVDVGQAVIHRRRGLVVLILILNMGVDAGNIDARAVVQSAAALRMALAGSRLSCRLTAEAESSHPGKRSASGHQKFTSGKVNLLICALTGHP
jgi:hypothetical protein